MAERDRHDESFKLSGVTYLWNNRELIGNRVHLIVWPDRVELHVAGASACGQMSVLVDESPACIDFARRVRDKLIATGTVPD